VGPTVSDKEEVRWHSSEGATQKRKRISVMAPREHRPTGPAGKQAAWKGEQASVAVLVRLG
jgi:hypothetical protein